MKNQSHDVYSKLRQILLHSELPDGTRLAELDWAARLQANRGALREALMALSHEGLLERGQRGGYFVPTLTREDAEHILATREVIESGAIRLLAENPPTAALLDQMEQVCDRMSCLLDEDYALGFVEADRRFHVLLVQLADNPKLSRLYENAPLPIRVSAINDSSQRRQSGLKTIKEHRRILDFLREGQYSKAIHLLHRHLHSQHRPKVLSALDLTQA